MHHKPTPINGLTYEVRFTDGTRAVSAGALPPAWLHEYAHLIAVHHPVFTYTGDPMFTIKITPTDRATEIANGKVADAEIHFGDGAGPLAGLKLIGFAIWERRSGGGRNVTFPARQYSVNGERRSFALLRPIEVSTAQNTLRDVILTAYEEYQRAIDPERPHPEQPTGTSLNETTAPGNDPQF